MPPRPISRVILYLPARTVPTGIFVLFGRAIAARGAYSTPRAPTRGRGTWPAGAFFLPPHGRNIPEPEPELHPRAAPPQKAEGSEDEEGRGDHQAVQARRGQGRPRRGRDPGHDGDRGEGVRPHR